MIVFHVRRETTHGINSGEKKKKKEKSRSRPPGSVPRFMLEMSHVTVRSAELHCGRTMLGHRGYGESEGPRLVSFCRDVAIFETSD